MSVWSSENIVFQKFVLEPKVAGLLKRVVGHLLPNGGLSHLAKNDRVFLIHFLGYKVTPKVSF